MTLGLVCDACDTLSPLTATVCPVCNSPLNAGSCPAAKPSVRSCPSCQSEVPREHRFCGVCGLRLDAGEARPTWAGTQGARARLILVKAKAGTVSPSPQRGRTRRRSARRRPDVPEDPLLSPRHATFFFRDNKLYVRDDNSKNGVFVRLRGPKIVSRIRAARR